MELHLNSQEDTAFLCSFTQLRGYVPYSTLPRSQSYSVVFTVRLIWLASFFRPSLSFIFKCKRPKRGSTEILLVQLAINETSSHSLLNSPAPFLSSRCSSPLLQQVPSLGILLQVISRSLGARTCTFFSISILLPCSITHFPAWICAVPRPEEQTFLRSPWAPCLDQMALLSAVCALVPEIFILKI